MEDNKKMIDYMKLYQNTKDIKIKGVGEKTLKKLNNLRLYKIIDLLYFFPRAYEDRSNIKKIKNLKANEFAVVFGEVIDVKLVNTYSRKSFVKAVITDETGIFEATWFQMPYLKRVIKAGKKIMLVGYIKQNYGYKMINPEYNLLDEKDAVNTKILPVYNLTLGLTQNIIRKIIEILLSEYEKNIFEIIPEDIIKRYNLMSRRDAIKAIHFPKNNKEIEEAKRRMAVEELLILEVGILKKRFEIDMKNKHIYILKDKRDLVKRFVKSLGFELTNAQKRVITEIHKDLNNGKILNRLIQGDVGSGKTIVVMIMLLYMIENGYQGVIMAPTEILAQQHFLGIVDVMNNLGIRTEILTGSITGKKKTKILKEIEEGVINLVIGTHALIEDNVKFKNLALIVIDEQHRFGVIQRKNLREKGNLANLIVMSATPIPRSLALSIYGDLDVSIIDELPPGREKINTKWIKNENNLDKLYDFMEKNIKEGRQVYMVCPLIEESEKIKLKSASELFAELKTNKFKKYKLGLLHGKMKNVEKEEITRKFKEGKTNILVSTTVIEVGVDVANASIMVIMHAERFGLSQLHQLRGRVGRGKYKSYCFLVSSSENEITQERLKIMEKTVDGFVVAEEDLKLRRPGEIFGFRQSGISDLKFVDIIRDIKTIKLARDEAMNYLIGTNGKIECKFLEYDINKKFKV